MKASVAMHHHETVQVKLKDAAIKGDSSQRSRQILKGNKALLPKPMYRACRILWLEQVSAATRLFGNNLSKSTPETTYQCRSEPELGTGTAILAERGTDHKLRI